MDALRLMTDFINLGSVKHNYAKNLCFNSLELELVHAVTNFKAYFNSSIQSDNLRKLTNSSASKHETRTLSSFLSDIRTNFQNRRLNGLRHLQSMLKSESELKSTLYNKNKKSFEVLESTNMKSSINKIVKRSDIVLLVTIHQSEKPGYLSDQFLFRGNQKLINLRDSISCPIHKFKNYDISQISQSYLYLDGKLYLEYGKKCQKSSSTCESKQNDRIFEEGFMMPGTLALPMETTRFVDLIVRVGQGAWGIICHYEKCEHVVCISDVQMFYCLNEIKINISCTQKIQRPKLLNGKCEVCLNKIAKRVTYYDKEALHNKMRFCEDCYRRLHYDEDGKSLYNDYFVYPYIHF